jgi:hypothetical protein
MPSIKDIVAGQSVGVGKRVIKAGADKLRGIINQKSGGGMPSFNGFKVKSLTYPMGVDSDKRQGHYVIFTIREISKRAEVLKNKLDSDIKKQTGQKALKKITGGVQSNIYVMDIDKKARKEDIKLAEAYETASENAKEIKREDERQYVMRPPTRRTSTLITLYMPAQVKNITGAEYESSEMSPLTTGGATAIGAMFREDIALDDVSMGAMGKAAMKKAAEMFEQVGFGGVSDQMQLATGVAIGDRMEFVFKNPKKRAFPYQFDFYPKSEEEAQEVHAIIQTFRQHMLPKISTELSGKESMQGNPIFNVPNQFNIEYYYKGNHNNFLNKIGSCYLTDCDVTYGGDRYTAFTASSTKRNSDNSGGEPGASPTEIHMTLNFQEMDIITHDDVAEGY